jgi:hypothetical protein
MTRSHDFFWWSCSELVTHDLFVRPLWSGLSSRDPITWSCSACNTASAPHNCILSGTHCTCQCLLLFPSVFFGFFCQLLLLKGACSLNQRSNLCLAIESRFSGMSQADVFGAWNEDGCLGTSLIRYHEDRVKSVTLFRRVRSVTCDPAK